MIMCDWSRDFLFFYLSRDAAPALCVFVFKGVLVTRGKNLKDDDVGLSLVGF